MRAARAHIESGHPEAARSEVHDVLSHMFTGLDAARDDAVERTNAAIVSESKMKMEGSLLTNAERRGPPAEPEDPLPYPVQVDEAVQKLSDKKRQVWDLRQNCQMSFAEIAAEMGYQKEVTVRSLWHHAKKQLEKLMAATGARRSV